MYFLVYFYTHFSLHSLFIAQIHSFSCSRCYDPTRHIDFIASMVDPSGATEGIALGLRIIRDLHVYYMQFMSFHSDIEHAVTRMDRLTRILKVLEIPIQKLAEVKIILSIPAISAAIGNVGQKCA